MDALFLYLLKSSLWLLIFGAIYRIFLRKETFFRFNRWFLLAGLIASFVFPLLQYNYTVELLVNPEPITPVIFIDEYENTEIVSATEATTQLFPWTLLYIIGMGVCFLISLVNVLWLCKNASSRKGSFSFFNRIFIDDSEAQNEKERHLIYLHERAHVDQKHWVDLAICQFVCIVQWFNPLAYLYRKAVKDNHEYLADQTVLLQSDSPALYKATLINSTFKIPVFNTINSFSNNKLNRIKMMKNNSKNKLKKWTVLFIVPAFACSLWAFAKPEYRYVSIESNNLKIDSITMLSLDEMSRLLIFAENIRNNPPLIVIDGVVFEHIDDIPESISDKEIEIQVLKEEIAVAIYGEKGKRGVILIKTKKDSNADSGTKVKKVIVDGPTKGVVDEDGTVSITQLINNDNDSAKITFSYTKRVSTKEINAEDLQSDDSSKSIYQTRDDGKSTNIYITRQTVKPDSKNKLSKATHIKTGYCLEGDTLVEYALKNGLYSSKSWGSKTPPVFIFNGKIYDSMESVNNAGQSMDIHSITVFQGNSIVERFGEDAKYGVIVFATKEYEEEHGPISSEQIADHILKE